LSIVTRLSGTYYTPIEESEDLENRRVGLIAQDVCEVIPELYRPGKKYHGVRYDRTVAVLIEAIKEQQIQIESLEARILSLEGD